METIRIATLDGKRVAYTDDTEFLVEVGRGPKGGYSTKYTFTGNLAQAVAYFNAINIGNGYKKRLRAPSFNKPVLARAAS
jgi:hypothetical protein